MNQITEQLTIETSDGVRLAALLLRPASDPPRAVVQLNPATAVVRRYYEPFARHLAERGFAVLLYDYRGNGESAPPTLKGCEYRFIDYGTLDMPAVLDKADELFPSLPKLILGHSVGAHQAGFMPNLGKAHGLVAVGAAGGYPGDYLRALDRIAEFYFFRIFAPASHLIWGYCAAKRFGYMENLPSGVIRQWREWNRYPDYFFDPRVSGHPALPARFEPFPFPVSILYSADDEYSNDRSVPRFWNHVRSSAAPLEFRRLAPEQLGLKRIGHFGYFRVSVRERVWGAIIDELSALAREAART